MLGVKVDVIVLLVHDTVIIGLLMAILLELGLLVCGLLVDGG
jgi:hypothetical protein